MTPDQLRKHIIIPVLARMDMLSQDAEGMVLATGIHEGDKLKRVTQYNNGPARSYYQIEPATLSDLYTNYLSYRPKKKELLDSFMIPMYDRADNLVMNLAYATAVCRMIYYRVPSPIPTSLEGKAHYWKEHYNTHLGKGNVDEFIENVKDFIGD